MGKVKQIETKNGTYYFYNNTINIEELDSNLNRQKQTKNRQKTVQRY